MKIKNISSYLTQHEIIYKSPANDWHNGLPLGNGDMTAVAWHEGGDYVFGIKKSEVWDMRFERKKPLTHHKEIMRLVCNKDWKRLQKIWGEENHSYINNPYPSPKPCGEFKISGLSLSRDGYEERLSLCEACINYKDNFSNVTSFVHSLSNVLVVRYEGKNKGITFELNRHKDGNLGEPEFGDDGEYFWVDYTFPDGFRYVMMGRIKSEGVRLRRIKEGIEILSTSKMIEAYISVATSVEGKDPLDMARGLLEEISLRDYDKIISSHKAWWEDFWNKSFIEIPDKFLENLWYYQLYLLASSSRGRLPASPSPHNWYMGDTVPWHGDYHTNVNVEMLYWPIFASNHLELGEPFYRHFYEVLPRVKEYTKKTFGIKGAKYAFSHIPTGEEIAGGYWRYEIYVTAWVAQMFWWYYLYTRDEEFLKDVGYKVIKEVLTFYEGYIKKDEDGRYSIFPCHPVEQQHNDPRSQYHPLWEKNVLIDLALLKDLLNAGIKASRLIGKYRKDGVRWSKIRDKLKEYPHNNQVFLEYEGAPVDLPVHHADMLAPVFPCSEIDVINPDSNMIEMARRTFDTIVYHTIRRDPHPPFPVPTWSDDLNWCWLAIVAARLKLSNLARDYLYDMGILFHMKSNGFFTVGFNTQNPEEREKESLVNAKSNSGLGMAINEMLLQSHNGVIRVFPAIPDDWKRCRFVHLRAEGAFLVSSQMSGGRIKYILVEALKGGYCRIINPWDKKGEVTIYDYRTGGIKRNTGSGNQIDFLIDIGGVYLITLKRNGNKLPNQIVLNGGKRDVPREYKGPMYLTKVDEDKKWIVRLGRYRRSVKCNGIIKGIS